MKVFTTTAEKKDAVHLTEMLKDVTKILQDEWKVNVVALTSDASGKSKKARKDFGLENLHIVTLDCYVHQVSVNFHISCGTYY